MKHTFTSLSLFLLFLAGAFAQPTVIKVIPVSSHNLTAVGNIAYFTSNDSLFKSDGTTAGTVPVKSGLRYPGNLVSFRGLLFFLNDSIQGYTYTAREIWRSDGTTAGTYLLKQSVGSPITIVDTVGNYLYFTASNPATGLELYRTDGTAVGTILLKDINPGAGNGVIVYPKPTTYLYYYYLPDHSSIGSTLFFMGTNPATGAELWKTDGTAAGTVLVKDINPGAADGVSGFLTSNRNSPVYLAANNGSLGTELWKSDGTPAGTLLVKDVTPGANGTSFRASLFYNSKEYFFAQQTDTLQVWSTDGSTAGTSEFFGIYGDMFSVLKTVVFNGKIYFLLEFADSNVDLYATDGTMAGSQLIKTVQYGGDIEMQYFDIVNNRMIFYFFNDGYLTGFWKSDGTTAGTQVFYNFKNASLYPKKDFAVLNGTLYFSDHDSLAYFTDPAGPDNYLQLMETDLTTTKELKKIYGESYAGTQEVETVNGKLFFTTYNPYPDAAPEQRQGRLWVLDPNMVACGTGNGILREFWANVNGYNVTSIPQYTPPTSTSIVTLFEGPVNIGDTYAAKYKGYVCAPVTGNYTFWISSDDYSELYLSTDASPGNKVKIAYVYGNTASRQWNKYTSQQSAPVHLTAGHRYYIEALHKESHGYDNLAVGWQLPDGTLERPIPGNRLTPFKNQPPQQPFLWVYSNTNVYPQTLYYEHDDIRMKGGANDYDGYIALVEFYANSTKIGQSSGPGFGDFTWMNVPAGNYTITAKIYDNDGGVAVSDPYTIKVVPTGYLNREFWANINGYAVSSIPVNTPPTSTSNVYIFEGPSNVGETYGARYRGYILAPQSGYYTFWIASDDYSELWLSNSENPADKQRIAYINGATASRQWNKYATQQSAPFYLHEGFTYYIEALHKESHGYDNLAVGWQLPDGTLERPIPGNRLSPFTVGAPASGRIALFSTDDPAPNGLQLMVAPNPSGKGMVTLSVLGQPGLDVSMDVEVINPLQQIVYTAKNQSGDVSIKIDDHFTSGLYILRVNINGELYTEKLIVE